MEPRSRRGPGESESEATPAEATPFDRAGMWIWYVDRSEGGSVSGIVARAERAGIGTVYIKAGDGGDHWSQFSSALVDALHRGGLDACAWQFVYGRRPLAEAKVGAAAVRNGADCLVIDAEASYEGRYAAADSYVRALRARIGAGFPLSLAGFPYVDYHPAFPYSVFFGPGGATVNQPQMYWKAIGTSVRAVYEHTYLFNRLWGHPIYPIGQTYMGPRRAELIGFRRFAASYGGRPPSWWDWQETSSRGWAALGAGTAGPIGGYRPIAEPTAAASAAAAATSSSGPSSTWSGQGRTCRSPGSSARAPSPRCAPSRSRGASRPTVRSGPTPGRPCSKPTPVRPRWSARRARARRGAVRRAAPARRRPAVPSPPRSPPAPTR